MSGFLYFSIGRKRPRLQGLKGVGCAAPGRLGLPEVRTGSGRLRVMKLYGPKAWQVPSMGGAIPSHLFGNHEISYIQMSSTLPPLVPPHTHRNHEIT